MMRHDRNSEVGRLRAQVERVDGTAGNRRGPSGYLCCKHCKEDPIHDVAADGHDVPCSICDDPGAVLRERAEAAEAEVERLRAEIRDRESERADLRDRVQKAEAQVARVEALADWYGSSTTVSGYDIARQDASRHIRAALKDPS